MLFIIIFHWQVKSSVWFKLLDFFWRKKSIDLNRTWNQWFKSHWFKSGNPGDCKYLSYLHNEMKTYLFRCSNFKVYIPLCNAVHTTQHFDTLWLFAKTVPDTVAYNLGDLYKYIKMSINRRRLSIPATNFYQVQPQNNAPSGQNKLSTAWWL